MSPPNATNEPSPMLWDVFCRVIDNLGDIGVCWRLCADLATRGHWVRLWMDDALPLHWMAPGALEGRWQGVQVLDWNQSRNSQLLAGLSPADVWVEGFGCEIATEFIAHRVLSTRAGGQKTLQNPVWINLEYLSAESYVERSHGLPSLTLQGPATGWTKYFYYPGFTPHTGGLLREPDLQARQLGFAQPGYRAAWLAQHGVVWEGEQLVSLFCYEPVSLSALLTQLEAGPTPTRLLVTAGRAQLAVKAALAKRAGSSEAARSAVSGVSGPLSQLRISYLPLLTQQDYDHLLWACDLNFVRGEDSVVRALWAGKPLVWQIYPQQDAAHHGKLDAFLDVLDASPSLRAFHHAWNGTHGPCADALLPLLDLKTWATNMQNARQRLLQMDDLLSQLVQFVLKKR